MSENDKDKDKEEKFEEVKLKDYQDENDEQIIEKKKYKKFIFYSIIIDICIISAISLIIYMKLKSNFGIELNKVNDVIKQKDDEIKLLNMKVKDLNDERNELEKIDISNNNKISKEVSDIIKLKEDEIKKLNTKLKEINDKKNELEKKNTSLSKELENLKTQAKKNTETKTKALSALEKEYEYDKNFYELNNMSAGENLNKLGYALLWSTHTVEKGLSHFELRPFCKDKIEEIIKILNSAKKYANYEKDFSFINGINTLREYKKTYEEHKWTNTKEYKTVANFVKDFTAIPDQKTGAYILTKEELKKDYSIDYKTFLKSRHSTRNYKVQELKMEDIKEAIEIAKYSPSACNRQYIKVHYYPRGKKRQNVINAGVGKGGLYLDGVNTFIITFDVNGLKTPGERNQGFFNAGLFSTNFINALHSLGIGTCLIQFSNSVAQEDKLKQSNDIPAHERIAVILFAGYYDDKSFFAVSPRKDFTEYFKEHI